MRLRSGEVDPELAPGLYLRVDVEDNGIGMDRERQERCFEPFYTTKNADQRTGIGLDGAGLGLSSAYSIMKHHDGLITVRSEEGRGSVFSLYFPAVSVRQEGASGKIDEVQAVLLGFDEPDSLSMRTTLESLGVNVRVGRSYEHVVQEMRRFERSIAVVDVESLGSDFPRFLRTMAELPQVSVVAACARIRRWTNIMRNYPAVRLVEKPLGLWTMSSALRRAVQEQQGTLSERVEVSVEPPPQSSEIMRELDDTESEERQ